MASTYPIRQGLSVPRGENLQASEVFCEGGLDLSQNIIESRPGFASQLINFEPGLRGGYRRINGYDKFSTTEVPGTGKIIGVAVYVTGQVLVMRQAVDPLFYNVYVGTGTTWTQINPGTIAFTGDTTLGDPIVLNTSANTSVLRVGQTITSANFPVGTRVLTINSATSFTATANATATTVGVAITSVRPNPFSADSIITSTQYNWTGTPYITMFDGTGFAYRWDGTTLVYLSNAGAPADPAFGVMFNGYLFLSGYSSNKGAVTASAPLNDRTYTPVSGALEFVVGDEVMRLRSWRDRLIIFCKNSIWEITGKSTDPLSSAPFTLAPITREIGCVEGRTVQENNGDLMFLSQDGLRTIAGTANIGDTDTSTISRPIQNLLREIDPLLTPLHSVVIKRKTQYRLFYHAAADTDAESLGILGGIRKFRDNKTDWEWATLKGIKPSCADSDYTDLGSEYIIHGGYDGFVYRQERGSSFNGDRISERFTSVPLELGDYSLRKVLHRVTTYGFTEGPTLDMFLTVIYDYRRKGLLGISGPYSVVTSFGAGVYDGGRRYDDGIIVYSETPFPVYKTSVQGSGQVVQLSYSTTQVTDPYVIQGFLIEFFPAGRR